MEIWKITPDELGNITELPMFSDIGQYVEQMVIDLFSEYSSASLCYPNPSIFTDEHTEERSEFADMLFSDGKTLLIIECKGRKSVDLNSKQLERWLSTSLSKATKQLLRAERRIKEVQPLIGKSGYFHVLLDISSVENIIPMIVFYTLSDCFWREVIVSRKRKYPAIQIFDLRGLAIACKFLPESEELMSYLLQKQSLYMKHIEFIVYEELLLMYYLSNHRNFNNLLEAKSERDLHSAFSRGIPWSIPVSYLYDLTPENVSRMTLIFKGVSKLGVQEWDRLAEERGFQ